MDDNKIYLNYGDAQVELLAFLKAVADSVESYLAKLPWSKKRKDLFREAYSDIMGRGVLGASNSTGTWKIQYGQDPIDIESKSKKELEMYGEAAYFIQLLMNGLASSKTEEKKEEEKKEEEKLPVFSNEEFNKGLEEYIGRELFGNLKWGLSLWADLLDTKTNGIYSTNGRELKLAEMLRGYANSDFSKYSFEDSAYGSIDEFKRRLNDAALALEEKGWNLNDSLALNKLGINPARYFYTGADEIVTTTDGTLMTRLEYNNLKLLQEQLNNNNLQTIQQNDQPIVEQVNLQVNEKQPRNLTGEDSNWETEDYARIVSALGDVVSLGGFWANVGGSGVSLISDTVADIADENLNGWDVIKNLGENIGWAAAGFIPGGKLGKVGKNIVRWAPKLLVLLNDYKLLNDESNKKTWDKLVNPERLTSEGLNSEDLKNVTYWVRALTGTTNAMKSGARDIKYSKARGTAGLEFKTKSGKTVKLSNKEVDEINATGARKGLKAAEELFKSKTGEEIANGLMLFKEEGTRKWFANTRSRFHDQRLSGESIIFRTPELQRYFDLYNRDNGVSSWKPFFTRGTSSYWRRFDKSSEVNLNKFVNKLDPYRNLVLLGTQTNTPQTSSKNITPNKNTITLPNKPEHISPRQFGLPQNTNLNNYYRNAVGKNESYTRRSSTRFVNEGLNYQEKFDYGNGQALDIKISDGKLTITDSQGNTLVSNKQLDKSNYSHDAKKQISKIIDSHRRTLMSNHTIRRLFSKEFIQSVKNMKKKGLLFKKGGEIYNLEDRIQQILNS